LEALEICKVNEKINLILMDIQMPVMDGLTAFDEIRKIRPAIPVIAQTAYALESDKLKLLGRGFNDYLPKPIKKAELLQKILQFT
jgi:CheY-like chemotaxis protein